MIKDAPDVANQWLHFAVVRSVYSQFFHRSFPWSRSTRVCVHNAKGILLGRREGHSGSLSSIQRAPILYW